MARGQRAHEGTGGSEEGQDSAGIGCVPSALPSLGQAPAKHAEGPCSSGRLGPGEARPATVPWLGPMTRLSWELSLRKHLARPSHFHALGSIAKEGSRRVTPFSLTMTGLSQRHRAAIPSALTAGELQVPPLTAVRSAPCSGLRGARFENSG